MTQPTNNPLSYQGVAAINPPNVIIAQRAPATTDIGYAFGTNWIDQPNDDVYELTSITANVANWTLLGSSSSAILDVAHGGTGRATLTDHGVLVGAGTSAITQLAVGATGTVLAGATGADPAFTGSPSVSGTVTAGTGITATTGNITATAGNIIINGAAKQLQVNGGAATDFIGQATLVAGVATILNTNIAATDRVFVTRQGKNASTGTGVFDVTINPATSFVITSLLTDGNTETNYVSTVNYFIVREL